MDSNSTLQIFLIGIGVVIGMVGIIFLTMKKREQRTVGVLIFPLMPSIILFAINFGSSSSSATLDYLGTFGGPIAAYIALVVLAARYINKDANIEDNSKDLANAKEKVQKYEKELTLLNNQVETLSSELTHLRESVETARPKPLQPGIDAAYALGEGSDQELIIRTGGINAVRNLDVIVNSENTDMILARFYERSLSGSLRYMDAIKGMDGYVVQDCLAESLAKVIQENKIRLPVQAGVVIPTETTGLKENGIRYIFHVATVQGSVGAGYEPITTQIPASIENVFTTFEKINKELAKDSSAVPLSTILMPLLGSGSAKLSPQESADMMIAQIVDSLKNHSSVKKVFVLAFIESHRVAIRTTAERLGLKPIDHNDQA